MTNSNVVTAILSSVEEQERHTALYCCTRGWDGGIDSDTILQGVLHRFKAVGKGQSVEGGVAFRRNGLDKVDLIRRNEFGDELIVVGVLYGKVYTTDPGILHAHEIEDISKYMQEHVYH